MASNDVPGHAFISYVREDGARVDRLQRTLGAAGIKVWRDTDDLWPGQDWKLEIGRAIRSGSVVFIACFSENTERRNQSYQNEELILAAEQMRLLPPGKEWLIPIRFADCQIPGFDLGAGRSLHSIQRVDLFGDHWERGAARLVSAVRDILGRPPVASVDMARPGVASRSDVIEFQPPRARNLHFAGREDQLAQLDATLSSGAPAAILQAISGLGGIGKTELAIEYAHRRRDLYDLVFTLHAGTDATLLADMRVLAGKAGLSQAWDGLRGRVLQWLSEHDRWLLIFDNADALSSVVDFLPDGPGHVLVTSRDHVWRQKAAVVQLDVWKPEESVQFLNSRLGRAQASETTRAEDVADLLGHFPLALEQAAAFMEETSTSYVEYLDLFTRNSGRLLGFGIPAALNYDESIVTTWRITFDAVSQTHPAAMELLELCCFLAPDNIPEEILSRGGAVLPGALRTVVSDGLMFHETLGLLARYGLIRRSSGFISMHRLVQHVVRMSISREQARNRVAICVRLLHRIFPGDRGQPTDQAGSPLLAHVFALFPHAVSIDAELETAKDLLMSAAEYMGKRAQLMGAAASIEDAVTMTSEIYGSNAPQMIHSLRAAGQVLRDMGNLSGARACFERALAIEERSHEN